MLVSPDLKVPVDLLVELVLMDFPDQLVHKELKESPDLLDLPVKSDPLVLLELLV